MAKAIPNPEPSGGQSELEPWNADSLLLNEKEGRESDTPSLLQSLDTGLSQGEAATFGQLQSDNTELHLIVEELQKELEQKEQGWAEKQKEYEGLLDGKTETIQTLHAKVQELEQQIRPPTPKEDELIAMSEELEKESCQIQQERRQLDVELRQLKEDREVMLEEMRKMEMQMSKERAELARQRREIQVISEEIRQELERIQKDHGLNEKLDRLRKQHQETMRGKTTMAPTPPPKRPIPSAPTKLSVDLDAEEAAKKDAGKDKDAGEKKKDSGLFRRFFGQSGS